MLPGKGHETLIWLYIAFTTKVEEGNKNKVITEMSNNEHIL